MIQMLFGFSLLNIRGGRVGTLERAEADFWARRRCCDTRGRPGDAQHPNTPNLLPLNKPLSEFWSPSLPYPQELLFSNYYYFICPHWRWNCYHKPQLPKSWLILKQWCSFRKKMRKKPKWWLFCWWDFESGRPSETSNVNSGQDKQGEESSLKANKISWKYYIGEPG